MIVIFQEVDKVKYVNFRASLIGARMSVTLDEILKEIKLLRREVHELKGVLIPEVVPEEEEIRSIEDYEKRKREGKVKFTPLEAVQ